MLLGGLVSIGVGIALYITLPWSGLWVLGTLIAIELIIHGAAWLDFGLGCAGSDDRGCSGLMRLRRSGTKSLQTPRWREMDSNFQYASAVNLVVGPLGGLCFAIGCVPGEALLVQRGISDGAGRS